MKGGFNKIIRNIVAGASDTEFEKRLTKATFHLDSKEPKEKHVICNFGLICRFAGVHERRAQGPSQPSRGAQVHI